MFLLDLLGSHLVLPLALLGLLRLTLPVKASDTLPDGKNSHARQVFQD